MNHTNNCTPLVRLADFYGTVGFGRCLGGEERLGLGIPWTMG